MVKDLPSLIFIGAQEMILEKYPPGLNTIIITSSELTIGVDTIRDLKKQLAIQPANNSARVVLILDGEKLTPEAQNALLKTLEEPPANTTIILVSPTKEVFLPTVLSRCQIIFLPPKPLVLSPQEKAEAEKVLSLIEEGNIPAGLAFASKITDRQQALEFLDKLLVAGRRILTPQTYQKIIQAKRYLRSSTNVRLTLDNLFVNC